MQEKIIPLIINLKKNFSVNKNNINISGLCLIKIIRLKKYDINKLSILINDNEYKLNFKRKKGIKFIKGYRLNKYSFSIPLKDIDKFDIQNKIIVKYDGNEEYHGRIIYTAFDLKKGKNKNSKVYIDDGTSIYLRQTIKNTMYLTVRETNLYDKKEGRRKAFFGYILSKIYPKNNITLLYEKECSRYEESASVVYEELIDEGYKNVFFILNKDNHKLDSLDAKYKKNIIYKDSLKHIIYFFKAKTFISSESLDHALQLRMANKRMFNKIQNKNNKYVFLQHGVMYMVSLNSDLRTGFAKKNIKEHKIVVSSKLEAQHFIDMAHFSKSDLYICGLPKFDRATRYDNADKIVIMPTWRRWEVNEAKENFEETKYFKMIKRIISCIPKELKEKIVVLPHPLMLSAIRNNKEYKNYIPEGDIIYDEILKRCKVLITDYSSISYDAFYRGSNVIFYWEEKDECMEKYGAGSKLMINKTNAFGDICFNTEELKKVLAENYNKPQKSKYINRYKKIVEFDDNKNTSRLIIKLKKDNII